MCNGEDGEYIQKRRFVNLFKTSSHLVILLGTEASNLALEDLMSNATMEEYTRR